MFENLVQHLSALPGERLNTLFLEDVVLGAVWCEGFKGDVEKQELCAAANAVIEAWLREWSPREIETEGRRQQPLLRALIGELNEGRLDQLMRDELDVLFLAWTLIQRSAQRPVFIRPIECLKPYIAGVQKRRESLEPAPGLPNVGMRLSVYTATDLRQAQVRDVKVFAGIDLPVRGPVLLHRGNAKLIEGLPSGCAMAVEEGDCWVNGLVLGQLAATGNCEVLENISGAVIARRGDIRAANVLNMSTVISKEGNVCFRAGQEPKIVYAGDALQIREAALGGLYIAPRVAAGIEFFGGEVQTSATVTAGLFRHTDQRPLAIVLRRAFTCQDYGEVLPAEASRMLANAMKLRQRLTHLRHNLMMVDREVDEAAGGILIYLLGQEGISDQMQRIQRLRLRAAFVDRLNAGAEALTTAIEDRLQLSPESAENAPGAGEIQETLEELQRELMHLAAEGTIDRDLFEEREEVVELGRRLQRKSLTRPEAVEAMRLLLIKQTALKEKRGLLEEEILLKENVLRDAKERAGILARAKASGSRKEVLDRLLAAGRGPGGSEAFRRRANERYVKLMQRNIETKLGRAAEHRQRVAEIESRIRKIREKLWDEHMVSLSDRVLAEIPETGVTAQGRFSEGVRLCAWRHLAESAAPGTFGFHRTESSGEETVLFVRSPRGTIERQDGPVIP